MGDRLVIPNHKKLEEFYERKALLGYSLLNGVPVEELSCVVSYNRDDEPRYQIYHGKIRMWGCSDVQFLQLALHHDHKPAEFLEIEKFLEAQTEESLKEAQKLITVCYSKYGQHGEIMRFDSMCSMLQFLEHDEEELYPLDDDFTWSDVSSPIWYWHDYKLYQKFSDSWYVLYVAGESPRTCSSVKAIKAYLLDQLGEGEDYQAALTGLPED